MKGFVSPLFSLVVIGSLLTAVPASAHRCGNQDKDNRPNHCYVKQGEERIHKMSSCRVVSEGVCEYTHCRGEKKTIKSANCCCVESSDCPGAFYVAECIGSSGATGSAAPASPASFEAVLASTSSALTAEPAPRSDDGEWVLRKSTSANVCHVQKATASPLGRDVSRHDTRKAACEKAAEMHDPDLTDSGKCFTYGGGTVSECKEEGVKLPE